MHRANRYLAILVIALGLASLAIGVGFVVEGQAKLNFMKDAMREEQITLGLSDEEVAQGNVVDSAGEAQEAGDTIRKHRRSIAPTYNDLMEGGGFDPTNPQHVTYMQALNLENYLYMSVSAFGLITAVQVSGIAMIVVGIALGIVGFLILRLRRGASQNT
jgi:hypothetical protein